MLSAFKKALEMNLTNAIFAKEDSIEADNIFSSLSIKIKSNKEDTNDLISKIRSLCSEITVRTIFKA